MNFMIRQMKYILFLIAVIAVGCRNTPRTQNNSTSVEIVNIATDSTEAGNTSHEDVIQDESLDSSYNDKTAFTYEYIGTIHGYKIKVEWREPEYNIDSTYYFCSRTYILSNVNTNKVYTVPTHSISFNNEAHFNEHTRELEKYIKYTPHHTNTKDIITAPFQDFFFADLDFDGTEEFITDNRPGMAEQRGVGLFAAIYKLEGDEAVNCTKYFQGKSDVFNHIEEYFFSVNTKTKSIMRFCDGGIMNYGWDMYDYRDGKYKYRNYVSVELVSTNEKMDTLRVSIYPTSDDRVKQRNLIKRFKVSQEEFDKHKWEY